MHLLLTNPQPVDIYSNKIIDQNFTIDFIYKRFNKFKPKKSPHMRAFFINAKIKINVWSTVDVFSPYEDRSSYAPPDGNHESGNHLCGG